MKQKIFLLILLSFFILNFLAATASAQTIERRCSIPSEHIVQVANQIKANHSGEVPDAFSTQVELDVSLSNEGVVYNGVVEGYYRPEKTFNFSIVPTTLAAVQLNKDNHLLYVCGQIEDSGQYRLEIYFLGMKLRLEDVQRQIDEAFKYDEIKIKPLRLSLFNFNSQNEKGANFFKILLLPLYPALKVVSGLTRVFADLIGVNVQRVVLTNEDITISGGIDINNPQSPRFSKTLRFDSAQGKFLLNHLRHNEKN